MWNEDMDEDFLCSLVDEVRDRLCWPEISTHALVCAQAVVQYKYNVLLAYNDVFKRFNFLKKIYETFTWLVYDKDTVFDISKNIVQAREEVWERMFKIFH